MSLPRADHERLVEGVAVRRPPPADLRGTLYAVGPSFALRGESPESPMMAQGDILGVRFESGIVSAALRSVRTPAFAEEQRACRVIYRSFARATPARFWPRRHVWHPANSGVFLRGRHGYTLGPAGAPVAFSPTTLEHIPASHRRADVMLVPPLRIEPRAASFTVVEMHDGSAVLSLPDGKASELVAELPGPRGAWPTIAVTERHLVLIEPPLALDGGWRGASRAPLGSSLVWRANRATRLVVVPLDAPSTMFESELDPSMVFQVLAAHATKDSIWLDVVAHPDPWPSLGWWAESSLGGASPRWEARRHRIGIDLLRRSASMVLASNRPVLGGAYSAARTGALAFGWPSGREHLAPSVLLRAANEDWSPLHDSAGPLLGVVHVARPARGRYAIVLSAASPEASYASLTVHDLVAGTICGEVTLPWPMRRRNHTIFEPEEG